jgi:transcriptional regulator with XRE-family HTH domain
MLTLEEIVALLGDRNLSEICRQTGVSHNTLWRLSKGPTVNPSYQVVKTLSNYFLAQGYDHTTQKAG